MDEGRIGEGESMCLEVDLRVDEQTCTKADRIATAVVQFGMQCNECE